jgi:hypothetical protein
LETDGMDSQRLFRYVDFAGYLAVYLTVMVGQGFPPDRQEPGLFTQGSVARFEAHGLSLLKGDDGAPTTRENVMATEAQTTAANLTPVERQLVEVFRRLDPQNQRVLWNTLRHLGSGVPGACVVLAVNR